MNKRWKHRNEQTDISLGEKSGKKMMLKEQPLRTV